MVCQACGTPVAVEVRFCPKCGAQISGPQKPVPGYGPPVYPMQPIIVPRVQRNLQPLGILWCVFGVYRVIGGLIGMFFLQMTSMGGFMHGGWPYGTHFSHGPAW